MWIDIAAIVFICVTANHLGLIKAIEESADFEFHIINCVRCFSFWATIVYAIIATRDVLMSLAISFLASYIAIWLELLEGIIDKLYNKIYDKILSTED